MSARHSASLDSGLVHLESFFPVEWDAEGRPVSYATEATSTQSGETYFYIIRKDVADDRADNGCDCPECAPHEQDGPVPGIWLMVHTAPHCTATNRNGKRCRNYTDHESGLCGTHRKRAAK